MKNCDCVPKVLPIVTWGILTCRLEIFKGEFFDLFFVKYDRIQDNTIGQCCGGTDDKYQNTNEHRTDDS